MKTLVFVRALVTSCLLLLTVNVTVLFVKVSSPLSLASVEECIITTFAALMCYTVFFFCLYMFIGASTKEFYQKEFYQKDTPRDFKGFEDKIKDMDTKISEVRFIVDKHYQKFAELIRLSKLDKNIPSTALGGATHQQRVRILRERIITSVRIAHEKLENLIENGRIDSRNLTAILDEFVKSINQIIK